MGFMDKGSCSIINLYSLYYIFFFLIFLQHNKALIETWIWKQTKNFVIGIIKLYVWFLLLLYLFLCCWRESLEVTLFSNVNFYDISEIIKFNDIYDFLWISRFEFFIRIGKTKKYLVYENVIHKTLFQICTICIKLM